MQEIDITVEVEDGQTASEVLGAVNALAKRSGVRGVTVDHEGEDGYIAIQFSESLHY